MSFTSLQKLLNINDNRKYVINILLNNKNLQNVHKDLNENVMTENDKIIVTNNSYVLVNRYCHPDHSNCHFCDEHYRFGQMYFDRFSYYVDNALTGCLHLCRKRCCKEQIIEYGNIINKIVTLNLCYNNSFFNCFPKDIIDYITYILAYNF